MYFFIIFIITAILNSKCYAQTVYEGDINLRVDPGIKTCIFQNGKAGQRLEVYYQVVDGQHGDLDISFDVIDPNGVILLSDYKKSENSVIMDLDVEGDYSFCMDNTYSLMNSKLVFVYILLETENSGIDESQLDTVVSVNDDGTVDKKRQVLEWAGTDENGQEYFVEVAKIVESLSSTLKHVLKARHLFDIYAATKSRDSYIALEDTFIVAMWSGFQISLMLVVGMLQVYTIKKLFASPSDGYKSMF